MLLAAALLLLAGAAKLRRPLPVARALVTLGFPHRAWFPLRVLVRSFASGEIAVGLVCLIHPSAPAAAALAGLYGIFAATTSVLVRRRASCGCFGDDATPASPIGALLSSVLALTALAAATQGGHGLPWLLGVPPLQAVALVAGLIGALYAALLMFRELPAMWGAWSAG